MKFDNINAHNHYFDTDGTPLELAFNRKTIYYNGFKVILDKLPYLKNPNNNNIYFTTPALSIIQELVALALKEGKTELRINEFNKFNKGKAQIAIDTKFKYSLVEHFFIPGLITDIPSDCHLTPVYFNKNILTKFQYGDGYEIKSRTASFGYIVSHSGYSIPFGINPNGYVIMWLGDIINLPEKELLYLYSENIEPQYNIHSDFYRNQILNEWL